MIRVNTPIQGTGADILQRALGLLPDRLMAFDARITGTVHDEIILECPVEQERACAGVLKETMEEAGRDYLKKVPVLTEVVVGESWA